MFSNCPNLTNLILCKVRLGLSVNKSASWCPVLKTIRKSSVRSGWMHKLGYSDTVVPRIADIRTSCILPEPIQILAASIFKSHRWCLWDNHGGSLVFPKYELIAVQNLIPWLADTTRPAGQCNCFSIDLPIEF